MRHLGTMFGIAGSILRWLPLEASRQIAAFMLVGALSMGTLAVLLPIGEGPDEPAHIVRAAGLLRGQIIGHRQPIAHPVDGQPIVAAGFDVNATYLAVIEYRQRLPGGGLQPMTRAQAEASAALRWSKDTVFAEVSNTASYSPLLYVPSSAALGVSHAWRWTPHAAIVVARLTNAVCYLCLGALAVGLAGAARVFVLAILLLPMSLFLGACVGQDGLIIALTALGAVCVARSHEGKRLFWMGVACFALIAMAKPPYLPLCLALLVARGPSPSLVERVAGFLVAAGASLAWSAFAVAKATVPFWRPPYVPGPLYDGGGTAMARSTDAAGQIAILLAKPALMVTLPAAALQASWDELLQQAIGILAWLDLPLPDPLYNAWYAALVLACVVMFARLSIRTASDALVAASVVGIVVATTWFVCVVQYVSWTQLGWATIDGVQGRYLIPIAATCAMLPRLASSREHWVGRAAGSWVFLVSIAGSVVMTQLVVARYYLQ